jgi:hypothetical protein
MASQFRETLVSYKKNSVPHTVSWTKRDETSGELHLQPRMVIVLDIHFIQHTSNSKNKFESDLRDERRKARISYYFFGFVLLFSLQQENNNTFQLPLQQDNLPHRMSTEVINSETNSLHLY